MQSCNPAPLRRSCYFNVADRNMMLVLKKVQPSTWPTLEAAAGSRRRSARSARSALAPRHPLDANRGTPSAPPLHPLCALRWRWQQRRRDNRGAACCTQGRAAAQGRGSRARVRARARAGARARCALSVGAGGAAGQIALRVGLTPKTARGVEKLRVHIGEAPGPASCRDTRHRQGCLFCFSCSPFKFVPVRCCMYTSLKTETNQTRGHRPTEGHP